MRKINRNNLKGRITRILGNNDGASLVLVSVLAIIVLTAVVVLRVTTTTFINRACQPLDQCILSCAINAYSAANQHLHSKVIIVCQPLDQRLSDA